MGVIGVVTAMTFPVLIVKSQKDETVTRLKKAYSVLNQAVIMSQVSNGSVDNWEFDLDATEFFNKYLKNYMQIVDERKATDIRRNIDYKYLNGSTLNEASASDPRTYVGVLPDGTYFFIDAWSSGSNWGRTFLVDVNGYRKPNVLGRDLFAFWIDPQGALQHGLYHEAKKTNNEMSREYFLSELVHNCSKTAQASGYGCTAVIMIDGWQIKEDYPWK